MRILNRFNGELIIEVSNLRGADLQGANLQGANLQGADLQGADLRYADLRYVNLQGANLRGADLRYADLDFSCVPLSCRGTKFKVDDRFIAQILYHLTRVDTTGCSGGVLESVELIKKMAITDLFCEYRSDLKPLGD